MVKTLRRFLSRWQNLLALTIIGCYVFAAVAAPLLAPPDDPEQPSAFKYAGRRTDRIPHPPSREALLGTLPGQWDIFYTLVWGTRSALRFGLTVALVTACLGVLVGAVSGYLGGRASDLSMRVTDAFLTFPPIAGVVFFSQILFPTNPEIPPTWLQKILLDLKLSPLMLTLILFSWMPYARIINAIMVRLKQTDYVMAARSLGASHARIILRHMLPNALAPAIVLVARDVGAMVILEAAFIFIGVGGSTEWGLLLVTGRGWIIGIGGNPLTHWWVFLPASLTLVFFGLGWNLLGDGLNAMLDPRTARRARPSVVAAEA
jgi:peptide/nickel transport system permease protein